jgi:putative ABC transport system ATP-binding protein
MELITRLCRERGKTVVLATHDPRLAEAADVMLGLKDGRVVGVDS